jgi:CRP-like cAMP-binding protein
MPSIERAATIEDLHARKLFRDVPVRTIRKLLDKWKVNIAGLQPRTSLKFQRNNIEYVYLIISGYLEVRAESQLIKKGKNFLVGFRGPEQIVGEMKAIAKEPLETLITAQEACLLIEIPAEALSWAAELDLRIYKNIAALLVEKVSQERKRTEVIQMRQGEAQVAQTLLNFLDERGAEGERRKTIKGTIRQSAIADYIGCDRSTAARNLSRLKKRKIIEYPSPGRNIASRVTINDLTELKMIARSRNF